MEDSTSISASTIIDLLRHGDVEGGQKYRGQLDDPLSELGWNQLRTATANKQNGNTLSLHRLNAVQSLQMN